MRQLTLPDDVSVHRLADRRELLKKFNATHQPEANSLRMYQQRAFDLLRSERVSQAFAIGGEPDAIRERYGRHKLGQSLLLAQA